MTEQVGFDIDGGVGLITLRRPEKLNAVITAMSAELFAVVQQVADDPAVRALVITGAGERSFSVGSDMGEVDAYASPWQFRNRRDYCDALRALQVPVIAAVNGYAYGGGLELALSSDIRLAGTKSAFAAAEIKLGWIGGGGVTALLSASLSASDAALMLLTGDPIDAAEALRIGLVSRLVDPEELLSTALTLARTIASGPPIAAQSAKANLHAAKTMGLESAIQYEREMQAICMGTQDAAEGRLAFAEKRIPTFHGR